MKDQYKEFIILYFNIDELHLQPFLI